VDKHYKIGYTQGVFDMFHVGHLNLLNNAKKYCDYLIVGVNSDCLVQEYKHKTPIISEEERRAIVNNIKAVDEAIISKTLNKIVMLEQIKFDAVFIGDDWKGSPRWEQTKIDLAEFGVDVIFIPNTPDVSSSRLRVVKDGKIEE
jgi:glycerol-3-phosphate cytidylyltransferase